MAKHAPIDPAMRAKNTATTAIEIVHGDRNKDYGHPKDNHGCTAALWSAFLTKAFDFPIELNMRQVCMLNALQKMARDAHAEKEDNLIDVIGYMLNAEIVSMDDLPETMMEAAATLKKNLDESTGGPHVIPTRKAELLLGHKEADAYNE